MSRIGSIPGLETAIPAEPLGRATPATPVGPAGGASFGGELEKALGSLEDLQVSADRQAHQVANGGGNLHETALALEKADVSMRLAMKVRNKLVEAYQEVMRMPV